MSLSNPTAKNPSQRFIQWSGGEKSGGQLNYWDKSSEANIEVPFPFTFLVLDELNTITGYNDADRSGFWSNEVRDLRTGEFIVKTKSGTKARGKYSQIANEIKAQGAKYAKSVYIAFFNDEKELVIGNIKLAGAALTAWIEFNKKIDVYGCAIVISGAEGPLTKGATKYFVPAFQSKAASETTVNEAKKLDAELQRFLEIYTSRKPDADDEVEHTPKTTEDTEIEDLSDKVKIDPPAEEKKAPVKKSSNDAGDDSISLADVPF